MFALGIDRHKLIPKNKPMPNLRAGWALVRVRLAGICNTDLEILRGYHAFRGTPGHEFVGEVAEVRGVSARERSRLMGRRVVGEINVTCSAYGLSSGVQVLPPRARITLRAPHGAWNCWS